MPPFVDPESGKEPFTLCCCTVSLEAFKQLVRPTSTSQYIRIDSSGALKMPPRQQGSSPPSFYGHVRFSGEIEPVSGKPGLRFLPHAVVYCGTERTFLEALEHFKTHPKLHSFTAVFMEKHSQVTGRDGEFLVDGKPGDPGIVVVRTQGGGPGPLNVSILIPGGRFRLFQGHFEICPT